MATTAFISDFTFTSPINKENSFTAWNLAEAAVSNMHVEIRADGTGFFEWDIPELEETEEGSLTFDGNELTDYDGVFALPAQLVAHLKEHGYDMSWAE